MIQHPHFITFTTACTLDNASKTAEVTGLGGVIMGEAARNSSHIVFLRRAAENLSNQLPQTIHGLSATPTLQLMHKLCSLTPSFGPARLSVAHTDTTSERLHPAIHQDTMIQASVKALGRTAPRSLHLLLV